MIYKFEIHYYKKNAIIRFVKIDVYNIYIIYFSKN